MSETCRQEPASPCIGVCKLNEATELCEGCFRTLDEIAGWAEYSCEQKRRVLINVENRCERILNGDLSF